MITKDELLNNAPLMACLNNYFAKIRFTPDDAPHKLFMVKKLCAMHQQNFAYSTLRTNFGMSTTFTFEALLSELLDDSAGRCTHHNATVYLALVYIGFTVDLIKANMAEQNNPSVPVKTAAHAAIVLNLNNQKYLVDPGAYGRFTVLPLPTNHEILSKNPGYYKIIKKIDDVSSFILQKKKKESWVNVHFFSTNPIELSELNASSLYLSSKENPNYDQLVVSMFHGKKHFCLWNRDCLFTRTLNSAYVFIEQPSVFYALTTLESVNTEFAEVSRKAQALLRQHPLVNGYLAEKARHHHQLPSTQTPGLSTTHALENIL